MRRTLAAVSVLFLLSLAGKAVAQAPSSRPVEFDQSTPKGALKLLAKSIVIADTAAVRSCLHTTSPLEEQFAQGYSDVSVGLAKLKSAMVERFGQAASRTFGSTDGKEEIDRIDAGKVQVLGDHATVTVQGPAGTAMALVRVDGKWKVAVSKMLDGRDAAKLRQDLMSMSAMSNAAQEIAAEVLAGRYARMNLAIEAFNQKLKAKSTTQPSR